jgi:hypothetical protein
VSIIIHNLYRLSAGQDGEDRAKKPEFQNSPETIEQENDLFFKE